MSSARHPAGDPVPERLAVANIQRITLENHELRQALKAARNVTRLPDRPARRHV
jgi:hypothetical protein